MEKVEIEYKKNGTLKDNNIVNSIGIPIEDFRETVENRVAPVILNKAVENDTSNNIILEFDVDVFSNDICGNDFHVDISGYKYDDFPITEFSPYSQKQLDIINAHITANTVVLTLDGIVAVGAHGYVQYTPPANINNRLTDASGNHVRENSLIYDHPNKGLLDPYYWISNKELCFSIS